MWTCTTPQYGTLTRERIAALKGKSVRVGGGWQDAIHAKGSKARTGPTREVSPFAKAGIPVTTNFVNGAVICWTGIPESASVRSGR